MYLVIFRLTPVPGKGAGPLKPLAAADQIRSRAGPAAALEHVSARQSPDVLHLGLFCRTETEEIARECATELVRRVIEESPMFAGWQWAGAERGACQ